MLKLQKSSLILILIIVSLIAGCVSIYTLGYTPGAAWHKAEDVKSGTFGQNVGSGNYNFPGNVGIKKTNPSSELDVTGNIYATDQVTAGTMFKVGSSELSSSQLKINGSSLVVTSTGKVGIGTTSPQAKLEVNGAIKIGTQDTCNANTAGTIRYNSTSKELQLCNGTNWSILQQIWTTCGDNITFTYKGSTVTYGTVYSSATGKCWMDRNLGASRVATAYNDSQAYGDLFQWGRLDDGHQNRNSGITSTLSSTDIPGHSNFIIAPNYPNDWRSPQNNNLWQGVNGINNPCPAGWRIPTIWEWDAERSSWSQQNYIGAYASPLRLTMTGFRYDQDGRLEGEGGTGNYWSSTTNGEWIWHLSFWWDGAYITYYHRAYGHSVRCIKD